jgi:hypothetical protein
MKNLIIAVSLLWVSGCTTIPDRFTQEPDFSDSGGYYVESYTPDGFTLETFYKYYTFMPNPEPAIREAKGYFIRIASELGRRKGKVVMTPSIAELNISPNRNTIDGTYAIYVTGRLSPIGTRS